MGTTEGKDFQELPDNLLKNVHSVRSQKLLPTSTLYVRPLAYPRSEPVSKLIKPVPWPHYRTPQSLNGNAFFSNPCMHMHSQRTMIYRRKSGMPLLDVTT